MVAAGGPARHRCSGDARGDRTAARGLDGYDEAFTALRKVSGVVPSIMCMFGFNAGGGSYLPRQGSFVVQPRGTYFGLTGPGVVKSVLGEDVTPDELGGPSVHSQSGVTDFVVEDEVSALRKVREILNYIPNNNGELARYQPTSDPIDRKTCDVDILLKKAFNAPTGFNTPFEVSIIIQQICDHGAFMEVLPDPTHGITTLATIREVQREADKWSRRAEVDMTGVKDPVARAKEVREVGISLVLYHRSIDEETTQGALWDEKSVQIIREMCDLGLDIAIAGGVNQEVLPLLRGVPIYGIVVGRGITAQPVPAQAAQQIANCIQEIWRD